MTIVRRSFGLLGAATPVVSARAQAGITLLARFPSGTFLENLVVEPGGRVLFTNYFARQIEAWSPAGGHSTLTEAPAHPVSLTALDGGRYALASHGASFMDGPGAMRGQAALFLLTGEGAVERRIALPGAVFPNGAVLLGPDRLLLADSALGLIWQVDLASGAATIWLEHAALAPEPTLPLPGVNGLKRAGDVLFVSNSATRRLLRVRLTGDAAAGSPEAVAEMTGGVDDFAIARNGTVYAATHAVGLARLRPGQAAPEPIAAPGVEGSTAVALSADEAWLYALGTGGLATGGRGEAVLARLPLAAAR